MPLVVAMAAVLYKASDLIIEPGRRRVREAWNPPRDLDWAPPWRTRVQAAE